MAENSSLEVLVKSRKFWKERVKKAKGSRRKLINRHIRGLGERIKKLQKEGE